MSISRSFDIILEKISKYLIFFVVFLIYLLTLYPTVQTEDSGELITSALTPDIAHPPGYPLYIITGKIFSILLPFGNPAWRINVMSALFGAATVTLLYFILKRQTKNELISFGGSLLYAFSNIIWGQSNRAEVYTLNTFFLALIIYLLLRWHESKNTKWLYFTALAIGLGIGDHHLLLLALPAVGIYILIKNWRVIINPKIVFGGLALLLLGLSVYAYLPIRTTIAPYDNPAFIEHSGLYTWNSFINFVNRQIYGGTVDIPPPPTTLESTQEHLPLWVIGLKDFFTDYGSQLANNNAAGLGPLLKIMSSEYFYLPLFLFLPGLYFMFKKDWRWASFIVLLFLCYTVILLVFTPIDADTTDVIAFSTQPFMMPGLMMLAITTTEGFCWLQTLLAKKNLAVTMGILWLIPGTILLGKNFNPNNESTNYVAHDFNLLTLQSVPLNGYLISIGKDNMTFPLYYLRKIEKIRPDIYLEIYYSSTPVSQAFLDDRVKKNNGKPVFLDLLPDNYASLNLKPYNFVYEYGYNAKLPAQTMTNPVIRGIRTNMDYPNTDLKLLYEIKKGIMEKDPSQRTADFDEVLSDPGSSEFYYDIIGDYAYTIGDLKTAEKAYLKAEYEYGLEKIDNRAANPNSTEEDDGQLGMA